MADCLNTNLTTCLYNDPSTSCSYYPGVTTFALIPESVLLSISSSNNCSWLDGILRGNYTVQDVWRELLPTIYEPNLTNCYGEQYMDYFKQLRSVDREYSRQHGWLIPRGLASLTRSCVVKACQGGGATGNPDMTGVGMLFAYGFQILYITAFFLLQFYGSRARGNKTHENTTSDCRCFAVTTHECTGGLDGCRCSAVMVHSESCRNRQERGRSTFDTHDLAMKETTSSFLDTAIFFALSVAVGMAGTLSQKTTDYEEIVLAFVSALVASPLYTVLAFSSRTLRRRHLRRNLTSLAVILLCLGAGIPAFIDNGLDRWGVICLRGDPVYSTSRTIVAVSIGAIALGCELCRVSIWLIRLTARRYMSNSEFFMEMSAEKPWGKRFKRSWFQSALAFVKQYIYNWTSQKTSIWVVATLSLLYTLFAGANLVYYRLQMQRLAGVTYTESNMTYGQYLAAFIWVPVIVEYGYHVTFGTSMALESRLPTHCTVAWPATTAGVRHSREVGRRGRRGSGEGDPRSHQIPYSSPDDTAGEREWRTYPV